VDIAIDGHGSVDLVVAAGADRDGNIVDHAEAFAVVGEGVVESSADADAHSVGQRLAGGEDGAASGSQKASASSREYGISISISSRGLRVPVRSFCTYSGLWTRRMSWSVASWGSRKSSASGYTGGDQAIVNAAIFFGGEDVVADGEETAVAIDELEGSAGEALHHTLNAMSS
jgi:hypothetical protein